MSDSRLVKLVEVPHNQDLSSITVLNEYNTASTGYDLTYVQNDKGPELLHVMNLKNGKLSEKISIKTINFMDEIDEIKNKYKKNLQPFSSRRVRILVDETWKKEPSTKPAKCIKGVIRRVSKKINELTGYEYEIEFKRYYLDEWQDAQLHACLLKLMLMVQDDGSINKGHIDELDQLAVHFGSEYLNPGIVIDDILKVDIKFKEVSKAEQGQQELDFDKETGKKTEDKDTEDVPE